MSGLTLKDRIPEAAAVAVLIVFGLTLWLGVRYVSQAEWVRHTLEVEAKIGRIWSMLQDIEIGQRSFVLTGDDRFLQPYQNAIGNIDDSVEALAKLLQDNPEQLASLTEAQTLIKQRLGFAAQTIAIRRLEGLERARDRVLEGHGLRVMQSLRDLIQRMRTAEERLYEVRAATAKTTIVVLTLAILIGLFVTVLALATWIMNARRSASALSHTNARLTASIAERDAAENQVRQIQKMDAVGQLTGGIAHDFNNMLTIIISGVSLAQRRIAKGEAGADGFLTGALEGAQRAASLVKRLLAFSRQQPLAPEAIDANRFVAGISDLIARALGESVKMETILGGGLWLAHADALQLENSILNLCVNARDAMPDGGRLTVETANCHLDDRYARLHPGVPPGQYVLIAVTDTGTGMTPDVLAKAFDPFFTTKSVDKGTGLGLSQVFGFVKQSGGHVKIYSELGQGTTIKIYLPRYYGSLAHRATELTQPSRIAGSERILLVEDDAAVLSLTAQSLRDLGYVVAEARGAHDALAQLKPDAVFDLMLTDIVMPDVSGRKLADQALLLRPDLKVVFMTGFTKNAVVHNGVLDPGVNFLAKPFTTDELSRKLREVLDTKR